jgi:hypothetical protein
MEFSSRYIGSGGASSRSVIAGLSKQALDGGSAVTQVVQFC